MRNYWQTLRTRERYLLISAALLLVVAALVTALFPVYDTLQRLRSEVPQQRRELTWMVESSGEAARLRAAGAGRQQENPSASRLTLIEETAGRLQLAKAMKRVEPDDQERLKVWLEDASYARLIDWLSLLADQGLRVVSLSMDNLETSGQVNARVTFSGVQ